jgi:hypothetical protein
MNPVGGTCYEMDGTITTLDRQTRLFYHRTRSFDATEAVLKFSQYSSWNTAVTFLIEVGHD